MENFAVKYLKEGCKWVVFLLCVAFVGYGVIVEGYVIRIVKADDGWTRSSNNPNAKPKVLENVPAEQQGMSPEEMADMDTVKIIRKYKVTHTISGLSYYDEKTNMICHVIADASLLNPQGITCTPYVKPKK
jgi:hypothetical protein